MDEDLMVEIPDDEQLEDDDNLDAGSIDADTLKEAMEALAQVRAAKARARERRDNMSEEDKKKIAQAAKERRAEIALKVQYAKDNGYQPSKEAIAAFLSAQEK